MRRAPATPPRPRPSQPADATPAEKGERTPRPPDVTTRRLKTTGTIREGRTEPWGPRQGQPGERSNRAETMQTAEHVGPPPERVSPLPAALAHKDGADPVDVGAAEAPTTARTPSQNPAPRRQAGQHAGRDGQDCPQPANRSRSLEPAPPHRPSDRAPERPFSKRRTESGNGEANAGRQARPRRRRAATAGRLLPRTPASSRDRPLRGLPPVAGPVDNPEHVRDDKIPDHANEGVPHSGPSAELRGRVPHRVREPRARR